MLEKLLGSLSLLGQPVEHRRGKVEEFLLFIASQFRHRIRQSLSTSNKISAENLVYAGRRMSCLIFFQQSIR